jgi:hypothetical protein
LQIGIDRYGWRRAMMLHGILIALAVPGLAGMIYSSPPDAGTTSDAPGVDGIVQGPHCSAQPFESAVPISIGGPSWNT